MPPTNRDWARGYAKQALSDLQARERLVAARSEKCHRLHFLQMAAEKTCKAHLVIENGRDYVRNVHTYVAKVLPIVARAFYAKIHGGAEIQSWQIGKIATLASEIEVLAPAVKRDERRNDNSEYPWEDGHGEIQIPCEYNFPRINDGPKDKTITLLISLIRTASESYAR